MDGLGSLAPRLLALSNLFIQKQHVDRYGSVESVLGQGLTLSGFHPAPALGAQLQFVCNYENIIKLEVVGANNGTVQAALDRRPDGVAVGDTVRLAGEAGIAPSDGWLGRVVDAYGRSMDGAATPPPGPRRRSRRTIHGTPIGIDHPPQPAVRRGDSSLSGKPDRVSDGHPVRPAVQRGLDGSIIRSNNLQFDNILIITDKLELSAESGCRVEAGQRQTLAKHRFHGAISVNMLFLYE